MATKGEKSPFNICAVTTKGSKFDQNGNVTVGDNVNLYFQSSRIYENKEVAKRTGVTLIDATTWEGTEPLIKIEQMVLSKKLVRLTAEVELTNGKGRFKTVSIVCVREKASDLLSDDKTKNLDGLDCLDNKGTKIGTFFNVRTATRDRFS